MSTQSQTADQPGPTTPVRPTLKRKQLADILLETCLLTSDQLALAEAERQRTGKDLGRALVDLGLVRKEQLMAVVGEAIGWEAVDLSEHRIDPAAASVLPEEVALRLLAIPIGFRDSGLVVAMANPTDLFARDDIRARTNREVFRRWPRRPTSGRPSAATRARASRWRLSPPRRPARPRTGRTSSS
jgi:hypothetical protein